MNTTTATGRERSQAAGCADVVGCGLVCELLWRFADYVGGVRLVFGSSRRAFATVGVGAGQMDR